MSSQPTSITSLPYDILGKGSSKFTNHSQEFLQNELNEILRANTKVRLTMEEFREKHKDEFDSLLGVGNEEEIKAYRILLDAARDKQLSRGRNHLDLKEKLDKENVKKSSKIRKLEKKMFKLKEKYGFCFFL